MSTHNIAFDIRGYCLQTIEIPDASPYSIDRIVEMLDTGEAIVDTTTGSEIFVGNEAVGTVVSSLVEGEMCDFVIDE